MEGKVISPNKVQGLVELNHLRPRGHFFDWTTWKSLENLYTLSTNEHMLEYITFTYLTMTSLPIGAGQVLRGV